VPPKLSHTDWVRRGRRAYRYTLKSVTLDPASGPGERPVVWWDRAGKGSADRDVQLALLSWVPDPTPAAAERTVSLDERMSHRWGTICTEPAAPAPVLWTFHGAVVGPSPTGWTRRGVAWPDAPDTWRSTPPPDLLRVSEPWRSGTPLADGLVQVAPAIAFGTPGILERALLGPRTGAELRPAVADDEQLAALVIAVGQPGGFRLADAVRIDAGGLTWVRLLLAIDPIVWEAGLLRLRALDASGGETGFVLPIDTGTTASVGSLADLPGAWSDPAGPWQAPAAAAVTWAASALSDQHLRLVMVECALLEGTTQIEIGAEGEVSNIVQVAPEARYWGVILVEGSSLAEALRFEHDQTMRQSEIDVINGALGADQAKRALLAPNTAYTVSVTYDVAVADVDDKGGVMPAGSLTDQVQRFRFQTDNAPPARLDPWVLATDPAPAQQAFFWGDPIRIVLATNAVRALFKAYGRDLFAIVRAASGRQPPETAGFDPSQVALDATVNSATPLTAFAVSPWESAIGEVVAGVPCVEHNGQSVRHERITLNMLLEPNTEYILDLEARPVTGNGLHPLFRRHFATGRYQSAAAFAAAVHETPPRHRHLANPAPLAALGAGAPDGAVAFARDLDFEQALRAAAWGDLARPGAPWATVIWQGGAGAAPQPFALLLEAPEPFWRQREVPKEVTDAAGTHRFQMVTEPWLEIAPTPAAAQLVARLVVATAGNRALVLLRPGARGGTLTLALRRRHHPLFEGDGATEGAGLVTADLTRALWEN
jgi:hypothetical protein